jgi:hypothetical protein
MFNFLFEGETASLDETNDQTEIIDVALYLTVRLASGHAMLRQKEVIVKTLGVSEKVQDKQ